MIPVRGFEDKTVAVFGLGRTGLTAARALIAGGAKVALWDEKPASREAAAAEGFAVVDLQAADWSQFAALMLSPGVPLSHPKPHWTVEKARAAGVEVLGDVELFARTVNAAPAHKRPKIIAITGTNGKSTTTALIGHLCASAGRDTRVGGNIGLGVLGLEDMHGGAVYVLELSSYQLDLTSSLKPDAVVLLNISPDHLDRHGGMDGYIAAKRRIFLNQGKGDTAIIGVDDAWCQQIDLDDDHRRGPRPYGVQHDQAARAQAVELARPRNPGQQAIKAHAKGAHPHDIVGELFHPLHIGADVVQLDVRFREDHQGAPGRGKRGQSA